MHSSLNYYLAPLLIQVALPYLVAALILITRLSDILGSGTPRSFYENYSGVGGPEMVQRTTNQLTNQFEFPVLFLTLIALAVTGDVRDGMLLTMAWAFAASRWLHAVVHLAVNVLWIRMAVFMVSNLVLLGMWIRLALVTTGMQTVL